MKVLAIISCIALLFILSGCVNDECVREKTQGIDAGLAAGNVDIQSGYYLCNEPDRGDVVVYNYEGRNQSVAARIVAEPGDRFNLTPKDDRYILLVNDKVVKTRSGEVYQFNERQYNLLRLYITDYHGVIPQGGVLILGDDPNGGIDSSRFGLVAVSDLEGKIG